MSEDPRILSVDELIFENINIFQQISSLRADNEKYVRDPFEEYLFKHSFWTRHASKEIKTVTYDSRLQRSRLQRYTLSH